jgi:hypothetical protein
VGGSIYAFVDRPSLGENDVIKIVQMKINRADASVTAVYEGDGEWKGICTYTLTDISITSSPWREDRMIQNVITKHWFYNEDTKNFVAY